VIKRILLGVLALGLSGVLGQAMPTTGARDALKQISPDECKQELDRLRMVVEACAQELQQPTTAPKACDPSLTGPDETVSIAGGKRSLQYDWLRDSLRQAAAAESAKHEQSAVSNASSGLSDARARLERMTQELASPPASVYVPGNVANIRRQLDAILESGDYPQAKPPSYLERIWNDFVRWLLTSLIKAMPSSSSSSAIYLLELAVIAIPCGLLIWWFIRRLQVQRLGLSRDSVPHSSAPSALDWEEWLEQGQKLGREGRWREAIHHVYWAAISCLESRRLWPADRTRTPREYLGLLSENPETRADLFSLTQSFEHSWYGELPAGEKEFAEACGMLERIAAR
jgi:Domain of unknown function (DUF4129)